MASITEDSHALRPMFLLADSQLLFWRNNGGELVLEEVVKTLPDNDRRAAYLGASNGNDPRFYGVFESAMDLLGITERRMIDADPSTVSVDYLRTCRVILLAGGDVSLGWRALTRTGVDQTIQQACRQGAILIGVSAGAIQLGLGGPFHSASHLTKPAPSEILHTFGLAPWWLDVHDEADQWRRLKTFLSTCAEGARGLGIPFGSGASFHPDLGVSAIKAPIQRFVNTVSGVRQEALPARNE